MKLKTLKDEESRLLDLLADTPGDSARYRQIIENIMGLHQISVSSIDAEERLTYYEESLDEEPEAKITPLPGKADEPIKEEPKVVPAISLADVKARFTTAAKSGVDVGKIINSAGYSCLSDVDPKDYGSLLKMLNEEES